MQDTFYFQDYRLFDFFDKSYSFSDNDVIPYARPRTRKGVRGRPGRGRRMFRHIFAQFYKKRLKFRVRTHVPSM
jgi:hypothetical protein